MNFSKSIALVYVAIACTAFWTTAVFGAEPAAEKIQTAPKFLPGSGLSQHPFLYCGEWDYVHPQQTMHLVRDGKEVWSYDIAFKVMVNGQPNIQELGDCTQLSNGNIVFTTRFGAAEITLDKKIVWQYLAPDNTEIHSIQPIGLDHVLLMQNGDPSKLMLINTTINSIEKQMVLPTGIAKIIHGYFRRVRMTPSGTFLAAHMDEGKVVEYDADGKAIWSIDAKSAWSAVRLKNGNTLIGGNEQGYVREVNPKGQTVWEITKNELPGYTLTVVQEVSRLANGNTVICNWVARDAKPEDWARTVQVLEVTPDKKVVWALRSWEQPNLGPASSIQLLDEPGKPEEGALQR